MTWNYRVVKKSINEEVIFEVCEVYYDQKGSPISYALNKNVLSQDTYKDLLWSHKEIEKAYRAPVLELIEDQLVELSTCPKCEKDIIYDIMGVMGDGSDEKDFGKQVLSCPLPRGCGYFTVRQDYSMRNKERTNPIQ